MEGKVIHLEDRRLYVMNENMMDFSRLFRSVSLSD